MLHPARTGSPSEYVLIDQTIAPAAGGILIEWLGAQ